MPLLQRVFVSMRFKAQQSGRCTLALRSAQQNRASGGGTHRSGEQVTTSTGLPQTRSRDTMLRQTGFAALTPTVMSRVRDELRDLIKNVEAIVPPVQQVSRTSLLLESHCMAIAGVYVRPLSCIRPNITRSLFPCVHFTLLDVFIAFMFRTSTFVYRAV